MSKTLEELQAYYDRKKDRRDDHARNMELLLAVENYDGADAQRKKSDELTAMLDAIEHCIKIVKAMEDEAKENPNIIKEPYNSDRWPLYNAKRTCNHVIELQWSGYRCINCDGWYCA